MENNMIGIILAGGSGTRLYPKTKVISKQLLPIYSVPLLYFPFCFLLSSGVKEFVFITNPENVDTFKKLLGDGSNYGVTINVLCQPEPKGIAQAYLIAEDYIKGRDTVLILGDNIFYGSDIRQDIFRFKNRKDAASIGINENYNCKIYGYKVKDPERYGVIEFNENNEVLSIEEKPKNPKSNYAAVGLYMCDETVVKRVKKIKPSGRGELEITDLTKSYLYDGSLSVNILDRDVVWLDAGTKRSYVEAINFVEAIEERSGKMIACPEEIAYKRKFITKEQFLKDIMSIPNSAYKTYLEYVYEDNKK